MGQAIGVFLPLLLFMMSPVLIPVITSLVGRVYDSATGANRTRSAAARATEAARHAATRRQGTRRHEPATARPETATAA